MKRVKIEVIDGVATVVECDEDVIVTVVDCDHLDESVSYFYIAEEDTIAECKKE